jgi:hypothetical protein
MTLTTLQIEQINNMITKDNILKKTKLEKIKFLKNITVTLALPMTCSKFSCKSRVGKIQWTNLTRGTTGSKAGKEE